MQAEEDGEDDDANGGYQSAVVGVDNGDGARHDGHAYEHAANDLQSGHEIDWSTIRFKATHAHERETSKDSSRVTCNLLRFCVPILASAAAFVLLRTWTVARFDDIERLDNGIYYSE